MIRVLLEISSRELRDRIAAFLRGHPGFRLLESFDDADSSESRPQPDVVILAPDRGNPALDPFEWSAAGVPIVLLADPAHGASQDWQEDWQEDGFPGSACALLPRNANATEIAAAIEAVAAGLIVIHPAEAQWLPAFSPREADSAPADVAPLPEALTPREIEVLQLLSAGLGNKEIAARLNISEHTAKFHVASIMGKLSAASRTEAVTLAIRHGLILI
jgi:DNA-binding NarL/FixJ family response regulator